MSTILEERPPPVDQRQAQPAPKPTGPSSPPSGQAMHWLRTAIGMILIVAVAALIFGPGRGMRSDIARQKQLITEQLEITQTQLKITERQLRIAEDQRRIALETLATAEQQLAIAREQLQRSDLTVDMQRQLLAIAEATLREAQEINRKTADTTPAGTVDRTR